MHFLLTQQHSHTGARHRQRFDVDPVRRRVPTGFPGEDARTTVVLLLLSHEDVVGVMNIFFDAGAQVDAHEDGEPQTDAKEPADAQEDGNLCEHESVVVNRIRCARHDDRDGLGGCEAA